MRIAAGVVLIGAAALIALQTARDPSKGSTLTSATLILAAFAALMLFIALAPKATRDFFQRMTNLKVAGVLEIGMQTVARAEIIKPPQVDEENQKTEQEGRSLDDLRTEIRKKLRFVHAITHMDTEESLRPQRSDRQIALWLGGEGLFGEDEAQFALDLISNRELGVDALPERDRQELLAAGWSFAKRFRFAVWDRFVRRELQRDGWVIADLPLANNQLKVHQEDFLASRDGEWAVVATRVGEPRGFSYGSTRNRLEKTSKRLEEAKSSVTLQGWCVIFPGGDRKATVVSGDGESGMGSKVKVLSLWSLLGHPKRAFQANDWNDDYKQPCHPDQD